MLLAADKEPRRPAPFAGPVLAHPPGETPTFRALRRKGLVRPDSPAEEHGSKLFCPSRDQCLSEENFSVAGPMVRIHLPPAVSLRTISSYASELNLPAMWTPRKRARQAVRELEAEMRLPVDTPPRRGDRELADALDQARTYLNRLIERIRSEQPEFIPTGLDLPGLLGLIPDRGALVAPLFTAKGNARPRDVDDIHRRVRCCILGVPRAASGKMRTSTACILPSVPLTPVEAT